MTANDRRIPRDARRRIDDVLWDALWERQLDRVERRNIARSVWRRQPPGDDFSSLVGYELAHRWRARALSLAAAWGAWTVFWALMVRAGLTHRAGPPDDLAVVVILTAVGVTAVTACFAVRSRLSPVVEGVVGFGPAEPVS